ncbi:MAG TPA: hypothetical protein PKZ69_04925 [Candidatus Cloacimonadota bacterium]|nr:hypothetical protein [Candidatus Cloacimonadota bacterium]HOQ79474.1 hypothetical protein [Candidatus Cloacimonadota bacterium]HPK40946.1 hypothetical protein [Candidatus Cloacimonadota bacterium]
MAKGKSFAAKVAHDISNEGKQICPVCDTEIRRAKLILTRESKAGTWQPKYEFRNVCKCNEQDIMAGKI